jgi:hypothetical protein
MRRPFLSSISVIEDRRKLEKPVHVLNKPDRVQKEA